MGDEKHLHAKGGIGIGMSSLLFFFLAFEDPNTMRRLIALHLAFLRNEIQSLVSFQFGALESVDDVETTDSCDKQYLIEIPRFLSRARLHLPYRYALSTYTALAYPLPKTSVIATALLNFVPITLVPEAPSPVLPYSPKLT